MDTENPRRAMRAAGFLVAVALGASCSSGEPASESSPAVSPTRSTTPQVAQIDAAARVQTDRSQDGGVYAGEDVIIVGGPAGLAVIDPRTLAVLWDVAVPATRVAAGFGSVWATDFDANLVHRLDAGSGSVQAEIPMPDSPIGIVVHAGRVWVGAHRGGTVSRIDPATNKVVAHTRVGPAGTGGVFDLAASGKQIYVDVSNTNSLVTIDARSGKVTRRIKFPDGLYACGPITPDGAVVWVTSCLESDHVARVDLSTGEVGRSGATRTYAGGGVVRGDVMWFSGVPVSSNAAPFVALDRKSAAVVGRLGADGSRGWIRRGVRLLVGPAGRRRGDIPARGPRRRLTPARGRPTSPKRSSPRGGRVSQVGTFPLQTGEFAVSV